MKHAGDDLHCGGGGPVGRRYGRRAAVGRWPLGPAEDDHTAAKWGVDATEILEFSGTGAAAVSGSAHLLTNPVFVNWLARSTEIPVGRLPGYLTRLSVSMRNQDPVTQNAVLDYLNHFKGNQNGTIK